MYTALLECLTTPGLDGMRFALILFKFAVFKTFTYSRFFRATVRPWCHLFLRQQTWQEKLNFVVVDGLRMWESPQRFPSLALFQASSAGRSHGRSTGY